MTRKIQKLATKGEKIYREKILRSRSAKKKGDFAAIHIQSGRYFLGKNPLEAIERGEKAFPKAKFHLVRIGYVAASSMKRFR